MGRQNTWQKKNIIVRNTNLVWCLLDCLFCLSKLLLLILPWWLSPPPLLPTLPSTTGSTPGIARNFTHRYSLFHRPLLYARPMRNCGEWKYSDFRGEISYCTHELYAENCIKLISFHLFYSLVKSNWRTFHEWHQLRIQRIRIFKIKINLSTLLICRTS